MRVYVCGGWVCVLGVCVCGWMCVCVRKRETERQTDRQTDTERQTDRQTETEREREGGGDGDLVEVV